MNYRALALATAFAAASALGSTAALAKKGDAKVRDDGLISQRTSVHLFENRAATSAPAVFAPTPKSEQNHRSRKHNVNGQ